MPFSIYLHRQWETTKTVDDDDVWGELISLKLNTIDSWVELFV